MYECGDWDEFSEGNPHSSKPVLVRVPKSLCESIKMISCGESHNLFLTQYGEVLLPFFITTALLINFQVFSWGLNLDGQLGLGHISRVTTPTKVIDIPQPTVISSISCGAKYSMLLSQHGVLYSTGR